MQTDRSIQKTLNALGICAGARRLAVGTPMVCEALKEKNKPRLVISASDCSENTAKRIFDRCAFYGVRLCVLSVTAEELGRAIGKRGAVAAVAVTDESLCRMVEATLEQNN